MNAVNQLRNPVAVLMGVPWSDGVGLRKIKNRLEDFVFNKTADSQRINEDYIDKDDDLKDVSDSVPVEDNIKTHEHIEREFFSGKWPLFLKI